MSYILEALRRAERERSLGQAPTAETLTVVTPPSRHRNPRLLALAAATLALALAALAMWLLPTRTPQQPALRAPTPAPAAPPAAAPPAAAPAQAAEVPVEPPPLAGSPVFEDETAVMTLDDVAAPFPAREAGSAAAAPSAGADADATATPMPEESSEIANAPAADAEPLPDAAAAAPASGAPPLLRDMPPAFRAQFPALTLQVHVYDTDPAKRWVMIDNRRYREGNALDSGPSVVEITPDGVIFEQQGERVLWPLVR